MSTFIRHEPCKFCASSDAMAVYADGSIYCFSCGTSRGPTAGSFVAKRAFKEEASLGEEEAEEFYRLPAGFTREFPESLLSRLGKTSITVEELYEYNYFTTVSGTVLARVFDRERSCERDGLVRNGESNHCGIEFKRLGPRSGTHASAQWPHFSSRVSMASLDKTPKVRFLGRKEEISGASSKMCGVQQSCALVEDSFSAIRVGRHVASYTLFGSSISNNKLSWLIAGHKKVFVWLDADKFNYAKKLASRIQLMGKEAIVIYTDVDPKYVEDCIIYAYTN